MITLALSKGRIFDETMPLLKAAGIEVLEDPEKSRKLILPTNHANVRVVLDLYVVGKDGSVAPMAAISSRMRNMFMPLL